VTVETLVLPTLMRDEGFRAKPYKDRKGVLTIGYGTNLEHGITADEAMFLLESRIAVAVFDCQRSLPWFWQLDVVRQSVLVQMRYQLGLSGLLGFRQMVKALERGDLETAADEMLDSAWAREDSPARAHRLAHAMRTGRAA
jgi:lysozyme